jgi:hypothetical protein
MMNFAGQPEVMDVITVQDMTTELNPNIINSEDIFKPNPLQNFASDSPNKDNYRCANGGGITWGDGLDFGKTLIGAWGQRQVAKSEQEQADRAREIAAINYRREQLEQQQQQDKSETFRKYGVPLIFVSVILVAGISTLIILKK